MKRIIFMGIAIMVIFASSCKKEEVDNPKTNVKEIISWKNLGAVHNYLVKNLLEDKNLNEDNMCLHDELTDMKCILYNSKIYLPQSDIKTNIDSLSEQEYINFFGGINLDTLFFYTFKEKFISFLQEKVNIDDDIKLKMLNSVKTLSKIEVSEEDTIKRGYFMIKAYNIVYDSSEKFWNKKANDEPSTREVIWADAAGALLGAACGGVMSVLMGAAASDAYVRAYKLGEEMETH